MSIDLEALRLAAEGVSDEDHAVYWGWASDRFHDLAKPSTVLALLNALTEAEARAKRMEDYLREMVADHLDQCVDCDRDIRYHPHTDDCKLAALIGAKP